MGLGLVVSTGYYCVYVFCKDGTTDIIPFGFCYVAGLVQRIKDGIVDL